MQTILVDITPSGLRSPTIHYSQGDVGREFAIDLSSRFGDSIPASPTITIQAKKPSGFGFSVEADRFTDGVAVFTTTAGMTDEAGRFPAELKVADGAVTLFTANFKMEGERNPHPDDTIDGSGPQIVNELKQIMNHIHEDVEKAEVLHEAEAWAVGQRDGVDVDEDDATYHNNSKYYAEQAENSETAAEASATSAATSELNAESYKDAAEGSATAAEHSAQLASDAAAAAAQVFTAAGDYSFSLDSDGDLWLNITIEE